MDTRKQMKDFYESLKGSWKSVDVSARVLGREIGEYSMRYHTFGFSMSNDANLDGTFEHDIMEHLSDGFMGDIVSFWILSFEIVFDDGSSVTFKEVEPELPGKTITVSHSKDLDLWHVVLPLRDGVVLVFKHYNHEKVRFFVMKEDGSDFSDKFNGWTIHLRQGNTIYNHVVKGHAATIDANIIHKNIVVFFDDNVFKLCLEDHRDVDDRTLRCD